MMYKYEIKWIEIIDSTNSEAHRQLNALDNLSVLAAGFQTAGRGQRGNRWLSKAWENLTFSIVLKPSPGQFKACKQFDISKIATLSVHDYLERQGLSSQIKWPNDLYVRDKKICGMLIENTLSGTDISSSIVGIGLNVNQTEFDPQLMNPTSIKKLTGMELNVKIELPELMDLFCHYLEMYLKEPEKVSALYLSNLYRKDELHTFRNLKTDRTFRGTIRGVTPEGLLQIEEIGHSTTSFAFKEVGYIL